MPMREAKSLLRALRSSSNSPLPCQHPVASRRPQREAPSPWARFRAEPERRAPGLAAVASSGPSEAHARGPCQQADDGGTTGRLRRCTARRGSSLLRPRETGDLSATTRVLGAHAHRMLLDATPQDHRSRDEITPAGRHLARAWLEIGADPARAGAHRRVVAIAATQDATGTHLRVATGYPAVQRSQAPVRQPPMPKAGDRIDEVRSGRLHRAVLRSRTRDRLARQFRFARFRAVARARPWVRPAFSAP